MRSMLSANLMELFPPSDYNSGNEVGNARLDVFQENVKKAWRQDTTFANFGRIV